MPEIPEKNVQVIIPLWNDFISLNKTSLVKSKHDYFIMFQISVHFLGFTVNREFVKNDPTLTL